MNFLRRCTIPLAVLGALLGVWLIATHARSSRGTTMPGQLTRSVKSALTNPVEFVRGRLTGGIGVLLTPGLGSGSPMVGALGVGSPAQRAGLKPGDVIVRVDGVASAGVPVAQLVEQIRGLAGSTVTLTIQRPGQLQPFECEIRRGSLSRLRELSYNASP